MNVGIIAHNSKKTLIEDFCIAYKGILVSSHMQQAQQDEELRKWPICMSISFLAGSLGGDKQFMEMIERGDMDMVIFFYNPRMVDPKEPDVNSIIRCCDQYTIPIATNIATAESLILGLDRGDLDWREQLR